MAELCTANPTVARKSQTLILQRLASAGQVHAGTAIGKSETWISRFASEHVESFTSLLAVLGLKVVPAEHKCYNPAHIEHLQYFAKLGMQQEQAPILEWEAE